MSQFKTLNIPSMSCSGCVKTIDRLITASEGVRLDNTDLEAHEIKIEFDEVTQLESVLGKLEKAGYKAV